MNNAEFKKQYRESRLNREECARLLGVSVRTVDNWRKKRTRAHPCALHLLVIWNKLDGVGKEVLYRNIIENREE